MSPRPSPPLAALRLLALACALALGLVSVLRAAPLAPAAFERAALLEQLSADLGAHYALPDPLELTLIRPWTSPTLPTDAAKENTDAAPAVLVLEYPEVLAPSLLLRVRYVLGERILREDTLTLRASLWRDGLVSALPTVRGAALAPEAVELRRIDALRDRESLPASALDGDFVFARSVPSGRSLTWRDVTRRPLVHRGQTIEVRAGEGALVITMKALAMQDGAAGESVRVRNLESKREFTARVVAENRVEVRL